MTLSVSYDSAVASQSSYDYTTTSSSHSLRPSTSSTTGDLVTNGIALAPDADLLTTLATVSAAQIPSGADPLSNASHQLAAASRAPMADSPEHQPTSPSPSPSYDADYSPLLTATGAATTIPDLDKGMSYAGDSASSIEAAANAAAKRQRTGRACDACRRRKVRCDGVAPQCGNCRTSSAPCTFLDTAKKRGPPKGYIEAIESRLHRMESLIGGMVKQDNSLTVFIDETAGAASTRYTHGYRDISPRPMSGRQDASYLPSHPALAYDHPPPYAGHASSNHLAPPVIQVTPSTSPNPALQRPAGYAEPTASQPTTSSPIVDAYVAAQDANDPSLAGIMAAVTSLAQRRHAQSTAMSAHYSNHGTVLAGHSAAVYPGPGASLRGESSLPYKSTLPKVPVSPQLASMNTAQSGAAPPKEGDARSYMSPASDPYTLPDALTSGQLIEVYRERIYPFMPVFHWRRFLNRVTSSNPPRLLLNAVYAYAYRYIGADQPSADAPYPGDVYFQRAHTILMERVEKPDLELVQALSLLSIYLNGLERVSMGNMFAGMAVRMAQQLQLHRDFKGDELERADRRRAWWGLIYCDRMVSTSFIQPLCIDEKDCSPAMLGQLTLGRDFSGDGPLDPNDDYYMHLAQLSVFTGRALRLAKTRAIDGPPPEQLMSSIRTLEQDLTCWWQALPEEFAFNPCTSTFWDVTSKRYMLVASLHALYYTILILIHRPYVADGSTQAWAPSRRSAGIRRASAHTIAHLAKIVQARQTIFAFPPLFISATIAATVLVPCCVYHICPIVRKNARADLVQILNTVRLKTRTAHVASTSLSNLETLCALFDIPVEDKPGSLAPMSIALSTPPQDPATNTSTVESPSSLSSILNPEPSPPSTGQSGGSVAAAAGDAVVLSSGASSRKRSHPGDTDEQTTNAPGTITTHQAPTDRQLPSSHKLCPQDINTLAGRIKRICPDQPGYVFPCLVLDQQSIGTSEGATSTLPANVDFTPDYADDHHYWMVPISTTAVEWQRFLKQYPTSKPLGRRASTSQSL